MAKNEVKIRLTEIAKEAGRKPKEVLEKAKQMGFDVKTISSGLSAKEAEELYNCFTSVSKSPLEVETNKSQQTQDEKIKEIKETENDRVKNSLQGTKQVSKKVVRSTSKTLTIPKEKVQKHEEEVKKIEIEQKNTQEISIEPIKKLVSKKDIQNIQKSPSTPISVSTEFTNTPDQEKILESKFENIASSKTPPSISQAVVARRMGIRIVKKGNEESIPKVETKKFQYVPSAQEMLEKLKNDQDYVSKKNKKVSKPKPHIPHKQRERRIDLLGERGLSSVDEYDDEQNEIMLFDLHGRDVRDEEEENQVKQAITERVRVQRKNPWMSDGSIRRGTRRRRNQRQEVMNKVVQNAIVIPEEVRVYEFAEISGRSLADVVKVLFNLGMLVTKNDFLDRDAIEILADEFKIEISIRNSIENTDCMQMEEDVQFLKERPPIVTIMGHVDHGKTSLLDKIRDTKVTSGEAGGITQHIGAYVVEKNGKLISFIDTPGHEAFAEMRSRGAQVTDIAIIVIAADDGVKPQTIEALNHAKTSGVQIIIAMNKIDKGSANLDKLKAECAELGFNPIDWGGEYEFIPVSAKTGEGIEDLLENILIQAEVLELKANPNTSAKAVVLEGSIEKGRGPIATVIVQNGTLKVGDSIVAGTSFGRVRALIDDRGRNISTLSPSEVAVVTGLSEVPTAGSILVSVESDFVAKETAQKRAVYLRQKELSKSTKVSFDELSSMVAKGQLRSIPIIVKADTQGSLEAIKSSLESLSNDEVQINVIGFGVGGITESDVSLAATSSNSLILGFNVRPTGNVKITAKELGVEIKTYSIIYGLIDDIKALISGLMSPLIEEENTGQAEVRDTFVISKVGTIAGCMVVDGVIARGINVRLIRGGVVVHTGSIVSLKRFKDDAKEVAKGYECGIMLESYNDIQVGDVFETYKEVQRSQNI